MKSFTKSEGVKVNGSPHLEIISNLPAFRRRHAYSILVNNNVLWLTAEGLDDISEGQGLVLVHCNGSVLLELSFKPADGSDALVVFYGYDNLIIRWWHWIIPWRAIRSMLVNHKRGMLPHLGIQGLVTCLEAIHEYLKKDTNVPGSIDVPIAKVLLILRERQCRIRCKFV